MTGEPPVVGLLGSVRERTAFSAVNRMWARALAAAGWEIVELDPGAGFPEGEAAPACVIHNDYTQRFSELARPPCDRFVAVRTWDFGPYPPAWVEVIARECDQLWVHTHWVASQALAAGIDRDRVRVVPLGMDVDVFAPGLPPLKLNTDKAFKFLFVGATVHRKGIDILLRAYRSAFEPTDDVCLVIKDHGADVFYQGIRARDEILALAEEAAAPEILYLESYLAREQLAALYRTCDVGVFPYRAEGFCIPIVEAMASGLPVIVPDFGACLDFCDDAAAFLLPVRRIRLPVNARFAINTLGFEEQLSDVDFCEVTVESLAAAMRAAFESPRRALAAKSRAARAAAEAFSEENVGKRAIACLEELLNGG